MTRSRGRSAELAEWAASLVLAELSPEVLAAARRLLVDRLGVGLGGSRLLPPHPTLRLAETMPGSPAASLLSSASSAFAPYAVLANGCAGDSLELGAGPDCVEAALAAAEVADASVGELLASLVVATEVSGYLRRGLGLGLEEGGLHPPAALGCVSAAAAVGRLLGYDATTMERALTAAASLAPMSPYGVFSGGAPSKTLYGGYPQFLGFWSCLFAERGVGGPATILEGRKGLAQAIKADLELPPFEIPTGYEIESVLFKAFGACRACHPTLTVLEKLVLPPPESIRRIEVWTYPFAVELQRRHSGDGPIAAQLSVKHSVALFLALGGLPAGFSFTEGNLALPLVRALVDRVSVEVDPAYETKGPRLRGARVRIGLEDGSWLEGAADEPRWGASRPATDCELFGRARDLSGSSILIDSFINAPPDAKVRTIMRRSLNHHV